MLLSPDREPDVFGAISHPARRRMLDLLVEADRFVNSIAGHFQMSRPAVSQHLRSLLDAGLVTEQRHGRERRYRLVPAQLRPVRDWMACYERFWDEHLVVDDRRFCGSRGGGWPPRGGGVVGTSR